MPSLVRLNGPSTPRRPARLLRIALGAVVAVTLGLDALVVLGNEGSARRHQVSAGGFELALPSGWRAAASEDPSVWFRATWQRVPGVPTGWLWVSRWSRSEDSLDEEALRKSIETSGGKVLGIDDAQVDGRQAKMIRYRVTARELPGWVPSWAPELQLSVAAFYVEAFGYVHTVGFSSWPNPPLRDAERIIASLRLFEPMGWRTVRSLEHGFNLELPATWNAGLSSRALLTANTASERPDSWAYVFRGRGDSISGSVASARRNIEAAGGQNFAEEPDTLSGRSAIRLEFLFPNDHPESPAMAHVVEWFVEDSRGRVLILAVGRNDPASTIAEDLSTRFQVL